MPTRTLDPLHGEPRPLRSRIRRAALLLSLVLVSCQTPQCQQTQPGPPAPTERLHFIQALSSSGRLVESYRFDSVRKVPIPDSYSVLPGTPATRFVDRRHQRVFHMTPPSPTGVTTVTPHFMLPVTGLMTQGQAFTIGGELIATTPDGRFLFTRDAPTAADPTHSRVRALPFSLSPPNVGTPVDSLLPANASFTFSTDGAHAYVMNGDVRERPQGVTGQIFLARCDFDGATGSFGACDAPITIDVAPFNGPCTGNFACDRKGYDAEAMAVDPQMRLLYVTGIASIAHGGSISFNRSTWAVKIGADRKLVANSQQNLPGDGKLFAEPHGRFLFLSNGTKLQSWAIDPNTLALSNSAGASGLGEPVRSPGVPLSVDCDDTGIACLVFSNAGLELFTWDAGGSIYQKNATPMPVGVDNVDVWLTTGSKALEIWPQDLVVGSNDEQRVDAIRFDLLGAIQGRNTQNLFIQGWPQQTIEIIAPAPASSGDLCIAQRADPLGNASAMVQQFILTSGGTLVRNLPLPTSGGQIGIAPDPGGKGNFELFPAGVNYSTQSSCGGTSIVAPVPNFPRHLAVDPLGRRVYVMSMLGQLRVYPVNRFSTAAGALRPFGTPVDFSPITPGGLLIATDLEIDERGTRLFATVGNRDQLFIIDLDANGMPVLPAQVRSTGQWPAAVAISPDNSNLYVLNVTGRTISRFGAAPGFAPTGDTALPAFTGPPQANSSEPRFGFEVAITGQLLYVSDYDADQVQFWGINEMDGSLTLRSSVPVPGAGRMLAVDRRF